jgi:hypothetical protein
LVAAGRRPRRRVLGGPVARGLLGRRLARGLLGGQLAGERRPSQVLLALLLLGDRAPSAAAIALSSCRRCRTAAIACTSEALADCWYWLTVTASATLRTSRSCSRPVTGPPM